MFRCLSDSFDPPNAPNYHTVADDQPEILPWLSPLEPGTRHQDARTRRTDSVGGWLLEADESRSRRDGSGGGESDSETLFCYGDPAVGKTHTTSLAIDPLYDRDRGPIFAVVCFYFDLAPRKEHTPTSILGSLLKQVVGGLGKILKEIAETFRDRKRVTGGQELRLPEIAKMFQTISASQPTLICIDALDDCVLEHRLELPDSLREIVLKSLPTRILPTGGPCVLDEIEKRLAGRAMFLSAKASKDDIIRYICARRNMDTTPDAMDSSLKLDISKNIPETISEIFLLDSLKVETILRQAITHCRRQKLSTMTNGPSLEGVHGVVLGLAVLMWVSHSQRPLGEDALCRGWQLK